MNKSVYLAGAMSCYFNTDQYDYPKKWREEVRLYVEKMYNGITLITPTDFYEIGKDFHKTEAEVMRFDLRMVKESDVVLVDLGNLNTSIGTSDEILYAFINGKPIIGFLEDESKVKNIHPWKIEQIDRIETGKHAMKNAIDYIYRYYVDRQKLRKGITKILEVISTSHALAKELLSKPDGFITATLGEKEYTINNVQKVVNNDNIGKSVMCWTLSLRL